MANTKKKTTTTKATTIKETVQEAPVVEAKQEVTQPVIKRYKFIANCNNINISNVIFNNIKVVIYEVDAPNYDAAFDNFQTAVLKMFNGDAVNYNKFMSAVFGNDILVETVAVSEIHQDIAKFTK